MTPTKSIAVPLIAAIGAAVLGGVFWIAGEHAHRLADVHAQLAMLRYTAADGGGAVTETNPSTLLVAANAAYRGSQAATDRNEVVRRLGAVVKAYADVLKAPASACDADPAVCEARAQDAAYNYEFAIRARDAAAKTKAAPKSAAARAATPVSASDDSDLPAGPTRHGQAGGPPPAVDMNEFKMVIPKAGEERKGAPDAGKGGAKVRKG